MTRSSILTVASFSAALWSSLALARQVRAAPELEIVGAEGKALSFTRDQPAFTFTFTIVPQNAEPVGDVRVTGEPFRDAAGTAYGISWQPTGKVAFQDRLAVPVTATLPAPGEYKAVLALDYGGQRHPFLIKVVRPPAAAPKDLPIVTLGATLTEVELPAAAPIAKIMIRNDGSETLQVAPRGVSFARARAPDLVWTQATAVAEPEKVSLETGGQATVTIRLSDLTEPGKYEGKVRLTSGSGEYKPLDVSFALLVKQSGWWAAALIGLGVSASFVFNHFFNRRRRLLVARRDLARVRERYDALDRGDLQERERGVITAVRRQLDDLAVDARLGMDLTRQDSVARINRKLEVLAYAVEIARSVALLEPAKAASARMALDAVAGKLRDREITLDELNTAYNELRELKPRTELRVALQQGIATVAALVKVQQATATGDQRARLEEVQRGLLDATRLHAADELDQAVASYARARRTLAPILAAALEARMQQKLEPFEDDAWKQLAQELQPMLAAMTALQDPGEQIAAYRDAQARFYRGAFEAIAARAKKLADERPAHKAELSSFAARIAGEAALDERVRADDAGARFTAAMAELHRLEETTTSDAASFLVAAPTGAAWLPGAMPAEVAMPARAESSTSLQRTIDRSDQIAFFGLLIISVLTGVQLLWVGDPTWGSFDAKLLAFLWGLGIHSVGNQPFKNVFHLSALISDQPTA
jgi:hypothetical protein